MLLNKQIPIKQDLEDDLSLKVNSIFYTIQGEGPFAGTPAIFVRLSGCNLQCPSCDTEYETGEKLDLSDIWTEMEAVTPDPKKKPLVVITGGEPFRQNISKFVNMLLSDGWKVQIETNGTLFVDLEWAFPNPNLTIVCSPKAGKINKQLMRHIKALKYVLHADSVNAEDGLPILALDHSASPQVARPDELFRGEIYIQPIDVQDILENDRHLKAAVASAMKFGYRLCLQTHKLIGVP